MTLHAGQTIVVPGSISNLGPAFDTLSVAVQLYLRLRIIEVRPDAEDTSEWVWACPTPAGDNRIETAFRHARARVGVAAPGLVVEVASDIPARAGIGSSGAAAVAGLRLYDLATGGRTEADWLTLACEVEGHPDNAAASLLGGLALSCQLDDGRVLARSWVWPESLRLVVATPDTEVETSQARKVLTPDVSRRDAVFNMQRVVLLVRALDTGRYEDLREALSDRLHQPLREPLVPGLREVLALDDPAILGTCLSGSGPSVLAVAAADAAPRVEACLAGVYDRLGLTYTIRTLAAQTPHGDRIRTTA